MRSIDLLKSTAAYQSFLLERSIKAQEIAKTLDSFDQFEINVSNCDEIDLRKFDAANFIYLIEVINFSVSFDNIAFCKAVEKIKKKSKYKFPKINTLNATTDNSVLYIGKSSGNFATRLKNHFLNSSMKTYSLQMHQLKNIKHFSNLRLKLHSIQVDYTKYNITNTEMQKEILEFLESSLHHFHKPLLGRSGH